MKLQYNTPPLSEKELRFNSLREEMEKHDLYALIIGGKGHWWTGRGYFRY